MSLGKTVLSLVTGAAALGTASIALADTATPAPESIETIRVEAKIEKAAVLACKTEFHLWVFGNYNEAVSNCVADTVEELREVSSLEIAQ